jgi:endonuclease/exonuclease/phosphatase family metal-dependent hydrolase
VTKEKGALTRHFRKRGVPKREKGKLLLASWNIANLGAQGRPDEALELIAHILKRFDLIAVQEVNEKFATFLKVMKMLGSGFDYVMNDTAGNTERLVFIYRRSKVKTRNLFGEVALRKSEYPKRNVTVKFKEGGVEKTRKYKNVRFQPFDRNPFIASFASGSFDFTLVNVHLYFGEFQNSKDRKDQLKYCRRVLEICALARWAGRRTDAAKTYDQDIVLLGDMNVPRMDTTESTYMALTSYGAEPVKLLENLERTGGTNINNDKAYDQLVFVPGRIGARLLDHGVFDFDNAVFKDRWKSICNEISANKKRATRFNSYVKHYLSDHRTIWVQLDVS